MKARITFYIGISVIVLNTIKMFISYDPILFIGIAVGLFFVFWGLKVGWTQNRRMSVIVGHIATTIGSIVTA